jgi:hypothetical protein
MNEDKLSESTADIDSYMYNSFDNLNEKYWHKTNFDNDYDVTNSDFEEISNISYYSNNHPSILAELFTASSFENLYTKSDGPITKTKTYRYGHEYTHIHNRSVF